MPGLGGEQGVVRDGVIGAAQLEQGMPQARRILDLPESRPEQVRRLILFPPHLEPPPGRAPPGGVGGWVVGGVLCAHDLRSPTAEWQALCPGPGWRRVYPGGHPWSTRGPAV